MNVSPLDLRQQRFRSTFRGFDKIEVASFLAAVADDYEQALRETDRLRQDATRMEAAINEHRELEKNLKATLLTAQRLADDVRAQADREAKHIVHEAEGRSDLLLEKTPGQGRRHSARHRRIEAQAQGRRDHDRGDDPDPPQHARIRPRTGGARARRAGSVPSPAARRSAGIGCPRAPPDAGAGLALIRATAAGVELDVRVGNYRMLDRVSTWKSNGQG